MSKNIEKIISSYIEGDISEDDKLIIDNYINDNPDFLLKINNIKRIMRSLKEIPSLSPSQDFLSNLAQNINNGSNHKIKSDYWFATNLKTTFAFSFILVVIAIFMVNSFNNETEKLPPSSSVAFEEDKEPVKIHQASRTAETYIQDSIIINQDLEKQKSK